MITLILEIKKDHHHYCYNCDNLAEFTSIVESEKLIYTSGYFYCKHCLHNLFERIDDNNEVIVSEEYFYRLCKNLKFKAYNEKVIRLLKSQLKSQTKISDILQERL